MLRPLPALEVKGIMTSKVFGSSARPWDVSFTVKNGNFTVRILEREREGASQSYVESVVSSGTFPRLLSSCLLASLCVAQSSLRVTLSRFPQPPELRRGEELLL